MRDAIALLERFEHRLRAARAARLEGRDADLDYELSIASIIAEALQPTLQECMPTKAYTDPAFFETALAEIENVRKLVNAELRACAGAPDVA